MSTKMSLAGDDHFHFYQDMFDRECKMRLCLSGDLADFTVEVEPKGEHTAGQLRVTVAIPRHVWDQIRTIAGESGWGWGEDKETKQ